MKVAMQQMITWDEHLQRIRELENIPKTKVPFLIRGWKHLRSVMGSDWLEEAWTCRHPWYTNLYWSLYNNSPWVKFHYAQIGFKLSQLSDVQNFTGVLERVRSGNQITGIS